MLIFYQGWMEMGRVAAATELSRWDGREIGKKDQEVRMRKEERERESRG